VADIGQFWKAVKEVANYRDLPTEKLLEYEQYFVGQLGSFGSILQSQIWEQQCLSQIELLRSEIARRSLAEESKRQHQEVIGIGKKTLASSDKTLFWARWAVGVAIVGVIATGALGISQICRASTDTSKTSQASPTTFPQKPTPTTVSPEPGASSNSATPSPEPAATAQSSVTPPESSSTPED
jgi:hypothetical protein